MATTLAQVRASLDRHPRLGHARITVSWLDNKLCLAGVVEDACACEAAVETAREVAPELPIENALTVVQGPHASAGITEQVQTVFNRTLDFLEGPVIQARCTVQADGTVILSGACWSLSDRRTLILSVSRILGIRSVNAEHLGVAPGPEPDDARLADHTCDALHRAGLDPGHAVRIHLQDRLAHLEGDVRTTHDHHRIIATIERVPGLRGIVDRLRITQQGNACNPDIALEQTLKRSLGLAHLPVPHLTVFVRDGHTTLLGEVDTPEQQLLATNLCFGVPGIQSVDNQLRVTSRHGRAKQGPREDLPHPSDETTT